MLSETRLLWSDQDCLFLYDTLYPVHYPGTVGSDEMAPYLSMFNGHVSNSRVFPNSRRFK